MPESKKTQKKHRALDKRRWRKRKRKLILAAGFFVGTVTIYTLTSNAQNVITVVEAEGATRVISEAQTTQIQNKSEETESKKGEQEKQESLSQPHIVNYTIAQGDIPAEIFAREAGYDVNDVESFLTASKEYYDFTRVRTDKTLTFIFDENNHGEGAKAKEVRYEPTGNKMIVVEHTDEGFFAREEEIQYEVEWEKKEVEITSSLYIDALDAGISEATIIGVGNVFSYTIDFASEIREGDKLTVLYEKRSRDGKEAKDGKVLAAKFTASEKDFYAYHFDIDENDDEFGGYYDEEARVLERQFLKAPLDFFRITSGYTGRRLHPVINKYTAHYQIDYAAPSGTPTFATARGTVVSAGWENGWGNIVRLKHSSGYTTHYAHLSGFAKGIKKGAKVDQGETIGFVGSTGWSTGPHVDYGMRLNGNPVNPLKIELPKGEPIEESQKEAFEQKKNLFDEKLR